MTADRSTRERLLDAGEKLFSNSDFAATSIRDLAAEAEVNIAAINYHFQSKEKLYQEVIIRALGAKTRIVIDAVDSLCAEYGDELDLPTLLRVFVDAHVRDTLTNPRGRNLIKLMAREMTTPMIPTEVFMQKLAQPVFASFGRTLLQIRPGLTFEDAAWIQFTVIGQIIHFSAKWEQISRTPVNPPAFNDMLSRFDSLKSFIEKVVDHVTIFSVGGIDAMLAAKNTE